VEPQSNNQISSQEFIKKELSEDKWAKIPLCTVQYCAVWAVWIRLNQKHIVAKNEPYINIKTFTCC
jgi:hypothetical protein